MPLVCTCIPVDLSVLLMSHFVNIELCILMTLFCVINGLIYTVVHHTKAWFFQMINMNTADNQAFFNAFKDGMHVACFSNIFWEPVFTRFVKNTLFNQTNFSELVQAWLNPC